VTGDVAGVGFVAAFAGFGARGFDFALHREGDAFAGEIDFGDGDRHSLTDFDDIGGVFDKLVGELADVDEAVLVHADVHERAECSDVGDDAGKFHSGLKLLHFIDAFGEFEDFELLARVASGFGEFAEDVFQCGKADVIGDVFLRLDFITSRFVAEEIGDGAAEVGGYGVHEWIAFRVNGAGVEGVGAVANAEEAGGLLEGLGAKAGDFE